MPEPSAIVDAAPGRLAENILYFARLLRHAGMPVGPGRVLEATHAVQLVGMHNQGDFYSCLFSLFVSRSEQRQLFEQAFHLFWRNPRIMERLLGAALPKVDSGSSEDMEALSRRLAEALQKESAGYQSVSREESVELEVGLSFSAREVLKQKDFEKMSLAELAAAKALIARMQLQMQRVPTRRFAAGGGGIPDLRLTLRESLRNPQGINLRFRSRRRRHPPLVVLCDISGSMSRYSRLFLHFMHAVSHVRDRLHAFVFATRLTNITRSLRQRDVDVALARVTGQAQDWDGGTRIAACLGEFNRLWSRRVLGQGAVTLIISDGLDRDGEGDLAWQMDRLSRSSRRLVWLNPLLRYEGFEPRARGIRTMLPYVNDFRSVHNLHSLEQLAGLLARL